VLEQSTATTKLLLACASSNHLACAQLVLKLGSRPDGESFLVRHTPLLKAIEHKHPDMVKLLLDYGAEPDRAGYFGPLFDSVTPLAAAARTGQLPMIQHLLLAGADVDWPDPQYKRTPLHVACDHGQHTSAQVLMAAGARTSLTDVDDQRPLDLAMAQDHILVMRALQPAVIQEALQSMEGLTVVRTLYDQLKYSPLVCPNMSHSEIRATLMLLAQALRTLCRYSAGLDASCQADLCGTATGMAHALRAYEVWKETRDSPSNAPDAGAAAISGLVSAGVGVKTRLQQLLADMQT
jgi:ankyrin repeat protein